MRRIEFDFKPSMAAPELMERILSQYRLDPRGIHGLPHWGRVYRYGQRLAQLNNADPVVLGFFAVFHDACREYEGRDPGHGSRGAALAQELHGDLFQLSREQLELLCRACSNHTRGTPDVETDITVLSCWDSDRLDLNRVGITPIPSRLCTPGGQSASTIEWATVLWHRT